MPRKKMNHFLAVMEGNNYDVKSSMFDMLRYDACYPIPNVPDGWVVVMQPYREGHKGGFTIARWASFGFRNVVTGMGEGVALPHDMRQEMESKRKAPSPLHIG